MGNQPPGWARMQRTQDAFNKAKEGIKRDPVLFNKMQSEGGDPTVFMSDEEWELLDEPNRRYLRNLGEDRIRHLLAQKKNAERIVKEKLEAAQYQNHKNARLAIRQGKLIDPDYPNNIDKLDDMLDKDEITLTSYNSILKQMGEGPGKDIITDQRVKTDLERKALDVSSGAIRIEELYKETVKARYTDRTIDDAAFDDVMTIANREHKTYQSNALGEAINYGMRQLISTEEAKSEMLDALISGGGDFKVLAKKMASIGRLQEENYSQYKRAMNEWFETEKKEGREPDDDDIYIKSRKLMTHYRGRELDEKIYDELNPGQAEKLRELQGFFTGMPRQIGKFEGQLEGPPLINTDKEYKALAAGTVFIDAETGKKYKKPEK